MEYIRLMRLSIANFKGCRRLELEFNGQNASLYGENAVGKTTIYDAFIWLLFGRDSSGSSTFDIKPLGKDGQVLDHAAVTGVEADLDAHGVRVALRRTFFEKWSTKRGHADATYDGNTSEYFVDGVPVKKYEYDNKVSDVIDEKLFRTLTDAFWFCGKLDWRERRAMLFSVCGTSTDEELLAGASEFAPLAEAMGRLSMDDFKKKVQAERKGLNGNRNTIPARLDECQKTVDELAGVDFAALRGERDAKAAQLEQLQSELLKLGHGALLDSKRNELQAARNALNAYMNENASHRASQMIPVEDRRPALLSAIDQARQEEEHWRTMLSGQEDLIAAAESRIETYRARWKEADGMIFTETNCPTCGQKLPQEAVNKARSKFQADVNRRKEEAVTAADREKSTCEAARSHLKSLEGKVSEAEKRVGDLEDELAVYEPPAAPEITDLPGYTEQAAKLTSAIQTLTDAVSEIESESSAIRAEIQKKIEALRSELAALDRDLGREEVLTYTRKRMDELRAEAQKSGERLEALDRLLYLCDEFTRYKTRQVEDGVNSRFELTRWKLFDEQVNGGLSDCCVATIDGVPYDGLNHGARVNAGLDVIRTLSRHFGIAAPLFLDGAESVTSLLPLEAQVIRLVVSEGDKKLRCEYGA